jgi:hypothetical protein
VRDQHVSGEVVIIEPDLLDALDSIGTVIPIVCEALGFSAARSLQIESLIRADYETYVLPALRARRTPKVATVKGLANEGNIARSAVNKSLESFTEELEECALALPMLYQARGEFVARSAWHVVEIRSPVGKGASGPGIVGGQQLLYGLARVGGDICLPTFLRAPDAHTDEKIVTRVIHDALERAHAVAAKLSDYALTDEHALRALDISPASLAEQTVAGALLVPQLHVGSASEDSEWALPVHPNAGALWEMVRPLGIERLVAEAPDDPRTDLGAWDRIPPEQLRQLLAFAGQMGLDTAVRGSAVTYLLRADGLIYHRHQHAGAGARASRGVAQRMSFDVAGFHDPLDRLRARAEAIGYIEYLATSETPLRCAERFGAQHAPALIKAPNARPLLCALRMITNDLVVCAARRRQAQELAAA